MALNATKGMSGQGEVVEQQGNVKGQCASDSYTAAILTPYA
jgi:hypothetical protein